MLAFLQSDLRGSSIDQNKIMGLRHRLSLQDARHKSVRGLTHVGSWG